MKLKCKEFDSTNGIKRQIWATMTSTDTCMI